MLLRMARLVAGKLESSESCEAERWNVDGGVIWERWLGSLGRALMLRCIQSDLPTNAWLSMEDPSELRSDEVFIVPEDAPAEPINPLMMDSVFDAGKLPMAIMGLEGGQDPSRTQVRP